MDLVDAVCLHLEQAQTMTASISERIDSLQDNQIIRHRLASEIGAIYLQISEAQTLTEILTHKLIPLAN